MAIMIIDQVEGYTQEILAPILPKFEQCNFNVIFNHCFLDPTVETIVPLHRLSTMDKAPLQPNCAYFLCKLEGNTSPRLSSYVTRLQAIPAYSFSIPVEMTRYAHSTEWVLPWEDTIGKDLIFINKVPSDRLGWYNKDLNILWMADIGNYPETALANIKTIIEIVRKYQRTGKVPTIKLTIGADPEFEVLTPEGDLFPADRLFMDPNKSNQIGTDGHSATGELRPTFATNPLKLSRNIKRLIRKLNNNPNLSGISILAGGGTKVATGGHIHFGIPSMPEELREALWKLVAAPILKFQGKLRNSDTTKCRKGGGDIVRTQQWGIEWRPLPSFIINEDITQAVLVTSYAIVKSHFMGGLHIGGTVKNSLLKLPLYPVYKEYIDKFIDLLSLEDTLLENRDILREWKLEKLNRNPSVIVTCLNSDLGKFFTPLYVSLKQAMKILINFGQNNYLAVYNLPPVALANFKEFADTHFVPCIVDGKAVTPSQPTTRRPQLEEYGERESRGGGTWDFEIYLPYTWLPRDGYDPVKGIFLQIKDLVKEAVIEFDSRR